MRRRFVAALVGCCLLAAGCDTPADESPSESPAGQPAGKAAVGSSEASDREEPGDDPLLSPERAQKEAPSTYEVRFRSTAGDFTVRVHRDWAPRGADRFYNLVRIGFYDDVAVYRVIWGFMAQFGLHGDPEVDRAWMDAPIDDDPVEKSNRRGYVSFAKRKQPDSRTTQVFVNYADNERLDEMGFAPFGEVVEGMETVDSFHAGYGGAAPTGNGPSQQRIREEGDAYLREEFPELDWIEEAEVVETSAADSEAEE